LRLPRSQRSLAVTLGKDQDCGGRKLSATHSLQLIHQNTAGERDAVWANRVHGCGDWRLVYALPPAGMIYGLSPEEIEIVERGW